MTLQDATSLAKFQKSLHAGGLCLVVAVVGLGYYFLYQPLLESQAELRLQIDKTAQFERLEEAIRTAYNNSSDKLASVEARINDVYARIPNDPQESDFLGQLAELCRESHLEIRDYRPGSVFDRQSHKEMEIKLSLEGSYEGLCRFLHGLETTKRLCRITDFNIHLPHELATAYPAHLTLRIYYFDKRAPQVALLEQ